MLSYANLRDEISHIRQFVMLNLFGLVCKELNTEMFTRTDNLRLGLIRYQVGLGEISCVRTDRICIHIEIILTFLAEIHFSFNVDGIRQAAG